MCVCVGVGVGVGGCVLQQTYTHSGTFYQLYHAFWCFPSTPALLSIGHRRDC